MIDSGIAFIVDLTKGHIATCNGLSLVNLSYIYLSLHSTGLGQLLYITQNAMILESWISVSILQCVVIEIALSSLCLIHSHCECLDPMAAILMMSLGSWPQVRWNPLRDHWLLFASSGAECPLHSIKRFGQFVMVFFSMGACKGHSHKHRNSMRYSGINIPIMCLLKSKLTTQGHRSNL